MLYRGTTPFHTFLLPLSIDEIASIYITYWQNDAVCVEKTINDIELKSVDVTLNNGFIIDKNKGDYLPENNEEYEPETVSYTQATVHLTQEDTLNFKFYPAAEKNITAIQIRVLTPDGEAYASEVIHERIYGILKNGVI